MPEFEKGNVIVKADYVTAGIQACGYVMMASHADMLEIALSNIFCTDSDSAFLENCQPFQCFCPSKFTGLFIHILFHGTCQMMVLHFCTSIQIHSETYIQCSCIPNSVILNLKSHYIVLRTLAMHTNITEIFTSLWNNFVSLYA